MPGRRFCHGVTDEMSVMGELEYEIKRVAARILVRSDFLRAVTFPLVAGSDLAKTWLEVWGIFFVAVPFPHLGWFLLPELNVIQEIFQFTVAREGRTYKEAYSIQHFGFPSCRQYRDLATEIFRYFSPIGLYPLPVFESLPIVESCANPFFVIANAGPKL
ncbi:hypothetical protein C8J57DRAFT_1229585 [Mycena rebaudengoi]|nr:hypothetical protein C8J57DRAFT_1229585 [Mycena rebaudengoi]